MKNTVRFCLAQINPIVGDLKGNTEKMRTCIRWAGSQGANIIVFPELSICGYPPEDLLFQPFFIRQHRQYLRQLAAMSSSIGIVVGFPHAP